jgi:diguanylate cyclase (GGDEF)-like protein
MVGIVTATLFFNTSAQHFTGTMVTIGVMLLVACMLQYNRHRVAAAEREALELSRVDALTKLANRRVFERMLAEIAGQIEDSEDAATRGGLILADVDNFKTINTTGGHKSGDEVLRMIAAVLDGAVGREATVCRIGGDEFAVIVAEGDTGDVMRAAAKCRAAVGAVDWKVLCEPNVTLSIGYAGWEHVDSWKDLVVAADLALQGSKDAGKNAVTSAPTPTPALRASRAS